VSTPLLPCPFCGAEEQAVHEDMILGPCTYEYEDYYWVECAKCGAGGPCPPAPNLTEEDAEAQWNRRAALAGLDVAALQTAARALLDRYVDLVNCGDCGNWDPEEEDAVRALRAALNAPAEAPR
jgi:Lar family restriction alleviation protein